MLQLASIGTGTIWSPASPNYEEWTFFPMLAGKSGERIGRTQKPGAIRIAAEFTTGMELAG